jgi:hypothetical protein
MAMSALRRRMALTTASFMLVTAGVFLGPTPAAHAANVCAVYQSVPVQTINANTTQFFAFTLRGSVVGGTFNSTYSTQPYSVLLYQGDFEYVGISNINDLPLAYGGWVSMIYIC